MKQRKIEDIDAELDVLEDEMLEMPASDKEWDDCVKKRNDLMLERIRVANPVEKQEKAIILKMTM